MGIWVQNKRKRLVWLKTTVTKMTQMWPKKAVFVPKIGFLTQKVGTKNFLGRIFMALSGDCALIW